MTAAAPGVPGRSTPAAGLVEIFVAFFVIGASSFGGGVVAYLRSMLVVRKKWLDEADFLGVLGIAQTLPGLNATNMSVIVGDRLAGPAGALAAFLGMTLPGGSFVLALGVLYANHADHPAVNAALVGVGAASVGLLAAVTFRIGQGIAWQAGSALVAAATVLMISVFHIPLIVVLVTLAPLSVLLHAGRGGPDGGAKLLRAAHDRQ